MIKEKPDDTPEVREIKRDLKWRLCVWEDYTLQFHRYDEELDQQRTELFDNILLEARAICPNWEELDAAGIERGRADEARVLRLERERIAANARAIERARQRSREREERERRRAAEDEEDEELRLNFGTIMPRWNFTIVGAQPSRRGQKETIRAAMKPTEKVINALNRCSICLSDESGRTVELECGHYFHRSCTKKWLRMRMSCPLCNRSC